MLAVHKSNSENSLVNAMYVNVHRLPERWSANVLVLLYYYCLFRVVPELDFTVIH